MATLNQLVAMREALLEAAFSGLRTVRDANGEEVTYRSQSELKAALASINSEIAAADRRLSRTVYPETSKGL